MSHRLRRKAEHAKALRVLNHSVARFEALEFRQLLAAYVLGNPTPFASIQAAVDAAPVGGTVTIEAGNYAEQVVIGKSLSIRGAQAGVDPRGNVRRQGLPETICTGAPFTVQNGSTVTNYVTYAFKVAANDVIIDGLTIQGQTDPNVTAGAGIVMAPQIAGTRIVNNVIQNNVAGIFLSNNSATKPAVIQRNVFIRNNHPGTKSGRAIYTDGAISGDMLRNVTIDNNFFLKNYGGSGTTTLESAIAFEAKINGKQFDIRVTNNVFDDNGKNVLAYNVTGMLIQGNYSMSTRDTTSAGLRFEGGDTNVTITGNNIYGNNGRAIRIDQKASAEDNYAFTITGNNIFRNGLTVSKTGLYINALMYQGSNLDATNNWWGDPTGPSGDYTGLGDAVYANLNPITVSPWATAPVLDRSGPYWGVAPTTDAVIQAEDYDHGGVGVGYNEFDVSNSGGAYRTLQSVDVQATTDTGGGYNVGWTKPGEWLSYTIEAPTRGVYTFNARVANGSNGSSTFHVEVDGVNVTGAMALPATGGGQVWTTVSKSGIALTGGKHVVRIVWDVANPAGSCGNLNWFSFVNATQPPAAPSNLAASVISATQVNLSWQDNSTNETGFIIERKTGDAGAWAAIKTVAANVVSYSDTTAAGATTYSYRVRATNADGDSAYTNEATVTTLPAGGITYLSDLVWASATNGWGPVERDMSNGSSGAGDGKAITLNGVTYAKGLGAHADSDVVYNLNGLYSTFLSDVGVDDETGNGSVIFQVFADGAKIYDSGLMNQATATQSINLSVTGVQQLRLHIDDSGDSNTYDHADWASARLIALSQAPAAPTGLAAQAVAANQVNLSWNDVATETGFKIERSLNGVTGWAQIGTTGAGVLTYTDTTVSPSTLYYYRVRATNSMGDSGYSDIASTTTPAMPQPPSAPTSLLASAPAYNQITLSWTDNATTESGFKIERSLTGVSGWTQIGTTATNVTSYTDGTVSAATRYYYRVRATNAAGDSAFTNVADTTTPAAPSVIYLSDLTWVSSTNGWGPVEKDMSNGSSGAGDGRTITLNAVTYAKGLGAHAASDILYNLGGAYTSFLSDIGVDDETGNGTVIFQVFADGVKIYDSGVMTQAGATKGIDVSVVGVQQLRLVITDAGDGNTYDHADWANARLANVPQTAPAAPTNLGASAIAYNRIDLSWTDNSSNEAGFKIERSPDGVMGWTQIGTVGASVVSYTDNTVSATTSYYYRVRATNSVGDSDYSNTASTTTPVQPQPPAAPSGLIASAPSSTQIGLTWTDNANNETGFKIERSPDGVNGWTQVGTAATNAVTWTDGGLIPGTPYFYRVRATNAVSDSAYSNVASATTIQVAPAAPTGLAASAPAWNQVTLTWTDNANNESGYRVERSTDNLTFAPIAILSANATSYSDTPVSGSTTYYYRVFATNIVGDSPVSNTANVTTPAQPQPPAAPSAPGAEPTSSTAVSLTWSDNSDNETGFEIERSTNGSAWTQIATTAANVTTYSSTSLTAGTLYYYRVRATNAVGDSAYTDVVTATPPVPIPLPSPWAERDIGTVGLAGSANYAAGTYTVKGAGSNIANKSDSFHFAYQQWTGDAQMIVRVTSVQNTNSGARAGIEFRETLTGGSKHAGLFMSPANGITLISRSTTGGTTKTSSVSGPTAPYWLRLVRSGNTLSGYRSADGVTWTLVGSVTISMTSSIYVGFAVCSRSTSTLNTSTFDNVSIGAIGAAPVAAPATPLMPLGTNALKDLLV